MKFIQECIINYIKDTNTILKGRAKRIPKYKTLIGFINNDDLLLDLAKNLRGEDEPVMYAILKMKRQETLQKLLEFYNENDPIRSFNYGAGTGKIYYNTSGATIWRGGKALWTVLSKIDLEHFNKAIAKTEKISWVTTLEKYKEKNIPIASFLSFENAKKLGLTIISDKGVPKCFSGSFWYMDILSLYEFRLNNQI